MPLLVVGEAAKGDLLARNAEPGRRIELLSPDYKAGALPLSYPGGKRAVGCENLWQLHDKLTASTVYLTPR